MFEGRKEEYIVKKPVYTTDSFNYETVSYEDIGTARIYIVVEDRTNNNSNDLSTYTSTLVGYTDDDLKKDYMIIKSDDKYIITSTIPHRKGLVLYLKDIEDGRE